MGTEELENLPLYAYEFTEQKEALSFLVSDNKLTQDNIMDAGMEYTRYCKAIELQRIKDSFGK